VTGQSGGGTIHTIFSVDHSAYQQWQADLLCYSHGRTGQQGPLTRLWSGAGRPSAFGGSTFRTPPYSPHPSSYDDYAPYNKPSAVMEWLRRAPPLEDTLLLLDPDCVFVAPVAIEARRGEPVAQPMSYMSLDAFRAVIARHCNRPARVSGVGIPIVIHRDDLSALAAAWLQKTEAIRDDPASREVVGWVADMWGYAFAAAELGLRHRLLPLARFPGEDRADRPLIHYCYTAADSEGRWSWDKRSYRPWRRVVEPPPSAPGVAAALVAMVNNCASTRAFRTRRVGSERRRPRGC
jgi:hypothetical protein